MFKQNNMGFLYNAKRSALGLFAVILIIGSLMTLYYLEKIEVQQDAESVSPKLLDFIKKYNYLVLITSLGSVIFMMTGIM